jgi:ferredoxin
MIASLSRMSKTETKDGEDGVKEEEGQSVLDALNNSNIEIEDIV